MALSGDAAQATTHWLEVVVPALVVGDVTELLFPPEQLIRQSKDDRANSSVNWRRNLRLLNTITWTCIPPDSFGSSTSLRLVHS